MKKREIKRRTSAVGAGYKGVFERREKKYLLSKAQYLALRARLDEFMEVDAFGKSTILNIYYDTPDYHLIRRSIEKPVYKEKLRLRCYGIPEEDGTAFLELKKKMKKVVYKRRVAMPYTQAVRFLKEMDPKACRSQIERELVYCGKLYKDLAPRMVIAYDRIAMAGKQDPELRITFDTNLRWRDSDLDLRHGGYGRQLLEEGQVLMEVKIQGAMSLELARIFSELAIFPTSFSKYGNAYRVWLKENVGSRCSPYAVRSGSLHEAAASSLFRHDLAGVPA